MMMMMMMMMGMQALSQPLAPLLPSLILPSFPPSHSIFLVRCCAVKSFYFFLNAHTFFSFSFFFFPYLLLSPPSWPV